MTQRPLLIAVEGCDGTGKTTLVAALVAAFQSLGITATSIKRPAKDALAAFYVQGQDIPQSQVLAMMNADCRAALDTARAMQANGTPVVIFDRYYPSAAIYQGGSDWQGELERQRERWGEPDLWVFCHAKWQAVQHRIAKRDQDNDKHTPIETIAARLAQYEWAASNVHAPVAAYKFSAIGSTGRVASVRGAANWKAEAWHNCDTSPEDVVALKIAEAARRMK